MIRVIFMKNDGDELRTKDLTLEQIQVMRNVDRIDFNEEDNSYRFNDCDFNVDTQTMRIWLKDLEE